MAKKILFHYPIFNIGGAERSTLKLIKKFLDNGWNVDVVLTTGGGSFEGEIDNRATIKYLRPKVAGNRFLSAKTVFAKILALDDLLTYLLYRIIGYINQLSYLNKEYDAAIVFLYGLSPAFCLKYVKAKKTVQWVRNDLALCDPEEKAHAHIMKYGEKMDYYLCVATRAYDSFRERYPQLKHKARMVYNMLEPDKMIEKAAIGENPYSAYPDVLKFVTVCRVSDKAKGLVRMANVLKRLKDEGFKILWFIVGDGPDKKLMEQKIKELDLEDTLIMLGLQPNPYPYYKYADVSATLSYYEGLCGTVNEAKVLGKPLIATRFSGVEEQLTNHKNGLIVENDSETIYEGLKKIILDENYRKSITNNDLPEAIKNDTLKLEQLNELLLN